MPANASDALDDAMKDAFPHLFEAAPDLLYQLVTMLSPTQLKQRGVPVHRLVHHEGSFVITFPNAYHAGFNTGATFPSSAEYVLFQVDFANSDIDSKVKYAKRMTLWSCVNSFSACSQLLDLYDGHLY